MKNKDLQELLKQYPDDMEVVMTDGSCTYETEIDFQVEDALLNSYSKYRLYYHKDYDGYWSFQYTPTKVLLMSPSDDWAL